MGLASRAPHAARPSLLGSALADWLARPLHPSSPLHTQPPVRGERVWTAARARGFPGRSSGSTRDPSFSAAAPTAPLLPRRIISSFATRKHRWSLLLIVKSGAFIAETPEKTGRKRRHGKTAYHLCTETVNHKFLWNQSFIWSKGQHTLTVKGQSADVGGGGVASAELGCQSVNMARDSTSRNGCAVYR